MQHMAVTASFEKESPMDEILNGKSIKADFEAQVTAALMIQSNERWSQKFGQGVKLLFMTKGVSLI